MSKGQALAYNLFEALKEITSEEKAENALNFINKIVVENPEKVKKVFSDEFTNEFNDGQPMNAQKASKFFLALL